MAIEREVGISPTGDTAENNFPNIFQRRGLQPEDITVFADMYGLSLEDAKEEILYFEVKGSDIVKTTLQYGKRGVTLTRQQAARLHFDTRFVNRTVDIRESQKPRP